MTVALLACALVLARCAAADLVERLYGWAAADAAVLAGLTVIAARAACP